MLSMIEASWNVSHEPGGRGRVLVEDGTLRQPTSSSYLLSTALLSARFDITCMVLASAVPKQVDKCLHEGL